MRLTRPLVLVVGLVGALGLLFGHVGSGRKLLLGPSDRRLYELHGTWHRMFDWGLADRAPVLVWVVALVAIGLIGLPYVWFAARSLPDRGFALARPVGLLLVSWLVWLLASAGVVDFSRRSIALSMAIVGAGALALAASRRREFLEWIVSHRGLLLTEEAVFWTLFAAALLIRWANPDLWHPSRGGEKPMDLAYLNAVIKSTHFPPLDPWFAGGQMNYYYFGFVLVAVLVKLSSIVSYVAYNLAIPTLFAFVGTAAFGATLGLVGEKRRSPRVGTVVTGLFGAAFVAVVGNLGEIRVLSQRATGAIPNDWWFWNATRLIHHPVGAPGPINEFPFFTFLFADLHAHAIALPFTVVLLALAVAHVRGHQEEHGVVEAVVQFLLIALVLGALWATNTWDVPTYTLLTLLALGLAFYARPRRTPLAGAATLVLRAGLLLALAYVLFLPFHRHYAGVFNGVERWRGSRTRMNDYLTMHGFFLFVITSAVLVDLATSRDLGPVARVYRLALRSWSRIARFRELHRTLVRGSAAYRAGRLAPLGVAVLVLALVAIGDGVPALAIGLAGVASLALVRRRRPEVDRTSQLLWQLTVLMFLVGIAITIGTEFLVARHIDVGRNNTVFKFYLQVWVLWALAAAVAFWRTYIGLPRLRPVWSLGWHIAFVALLTAACLYPVLATRAKIKDRFDTSVGPTLNGLAFTRKAVLSDHEVAMPLSYDGAAIEWMQQNVTGSPVVAELNTYPTLYGWGERFAMFTGNPTIVGWDYHQRQQRPDQESDVRKRISDVQLAYSTPDPNVARRVFLRYGVSYFVVGPLERAYYPDGQAKWQAREGIDWQEVYRNPGVQIYKLDS